MGSSMSLELDRDAPDLHFKLIVSDGKGKLEAKSKMLKYISTLKDGVYYMVVKREFRQRSLRMNSYYWGVVVKILCEYTGYTKDEMHEFLKLKFNSIRRFSPVLNKDLPRVPQSTAKLDNGAFIDYWTEIQRWAAMGGDETMAGPYDIQFEQTVYIPDPNEFGIDVAKIKEEAAA